MEMGAESTMSDSQASSGNVDVVTGMVANAVLTSPQQATSTASRSDGANSSTATVTTDEDVVHLYSNEMMPEFDWEYNSQVRLLRASGRKMMLKLLKNMPIVFQILSSNVGSGSINQLPPSDHKSL